MRFSSSGEMAILFICASSIVSTLTKIAKALETGIIKKQNRSAFFLQMLFKFLILNLLF